MSYPYKVVVSKSVVERIEASDRSESSLSLLPILERERMGDLLKGALERRGWEAVEGEPNKLRKKGERGEVMTIDLETQVVTTEVHEEGEIRKEKTVEAVGDSIRPPTSADEEQLRERVEKTLEKQLEVTEREKIEAEEEYRRRLTERLEETAAARQRELNEACLEVYSESLKERAASLGTVKEVHESRTDQEYELTITISE